MKYLATVVVLLASAVSVACGATAVNERAAIIHVVRANALKAGDTHITLHGVRISKLDPQYAVAQDEYTRPSGQRWGNSWILRRDGSSWHATSVEKLYPTCSAAPARVRKDLVGTVACFPPVGVYTSIAWTRGHSVRLRYCQRPGGPFNFIAASRGVTCHTAAIVAHAVTSLPCVTQTRCEVDSFRCVAYYDGAYGGIFENYHHALCRSGSRRVEWDGG